jgi:hypothetical protein
VTDAVTIGTAVVAYIEPHDGEARAFNRWYERDHFYAAAMAGPGMYAGARWVATRECKALRPVNTLFGDPARGSYLATYWLLPGAQAGWDAWAEREYANTPSERLFAGRDHVHTAVYRFLWDVRTEDAPPPATALDHGFAGVVALASLAPSDWVKDWTKKVLSNELDLVLAFASKRTIMSQAEPTDHVLVLGFCRASPLVVWRNRIAPALDAMPGLGFASPFLRTIPGTDTHVDAL